MLDLLLNSHGAPVQPDMGMRYRETGRARHVPSGKWVGRPRTERQLGSNLQTWPRFGGAFVMSDGGWSLPVIEMFTSAPRSRPPGHGVRVSHRQGQLLPLLRPEPAGRIWAACVDRDKIR